MRHCFEALRASAAVESDMAADRVAAFAYHQAGRPLIAEAMEDRQSPILVTGRYAELDLTIGEGAEWLQQVGLPAALAAHHKAQVVLA